MLSDKDRELISVGASLAANCEPCAKFHLRAARIAGASDAELWQAVNDALSVGRHATEEIARLVIQYLEIPIRVTSNQEDPLIRELVSISAACAIDSVPDLEAHLATARELGATQGQILSAIKIADAVKATAERKAEEITGRVAGMHRIEGENCCNPSGEKSSGQMASANKCERLKGGDSR